MITFTCSVAVELGPCILKPGWSEVFQVVGDIRVIHLRRVGAMGKTINIFITNITVALTLIARRPPPPPPTPLLLLPIHCHNSTMRCCYRCYIANLVYQTFHVFFVQICDPSEVQILYILGLFKLENKML